jgi:hypothetical protein
LDSLPLKRNPYKSEDIGGIKTSPADRNSIVNLIWVEPKPSMPPFLVDKVEMKVL